MLILWALIVYMTFPLSHATKNHGNACGTGLFMKSTGYCVIYEQVFGPNTWTRMRETCFGGDLVVINNANKNRLILQHYKHLIVSPTNSTLYPWIGLSTSDGTTWTWVNGQKATYTNWGEVSPNRHTDYMKLGSNTLFQANVCAHFNLRTGTWGSDYCNYTHLNSKLCEKSVCSINNAGCQQSCNLPKLDCTCYPGYQMDTNTKTCVGIDLCAQHDPGCHERCVSLNGTRTECRCDLHPGYTVAPDGVTCEVVDMCANDHGGCEFDCVSVNGTRKYCICPDDVELEDDGIHCKGNGDPQMMWMALAMYIAFIYSLVMAVLRWRNNRQQGDFRLTMRTTAKIENIEMAQAIEEANRQLKEQSFSEMSDGDDPRVVDGVDVIKAKNRRSILVGHGHTGTDVDHRKEVKVFNGKEENGYEEEEVGGHKPNMDHKDDASSSMIAKLGSRTSSFGRSISGMLMGDKGCNQRQSKKVTIREPSCEEDEI